MQNHAHSYYSGILAIILAALTWETTGTAAIFAPNVSPIAIGAAAMGFGDYHKLWSLHDN